MGPADGGGTLVVWTAALSADESVIAMVESMYDGGLAELTSTAARGFGAHAD
ncbi:hypothetical protein [Gordonia humi]|uniref:Uncharacterized protein n=1 Tax=Gordonia humi TaxID=686429 RepID=A0A840F019_9ACTN|nr:hypothetical protein [Gordonia humi]MBB4135356.1 hypothetical protein [Gordonia humi]